MLNRSVERAMELKVPRGSSPAYAVRGLFRMAQVEKSYRFLIPSIEIRRPFGVEADPAFSFVFQKDPNDFRVS